MPRGPKKHMKRLAAPSHWMLDKLSGTYAPRPMAGPHKLSECLPLIVFLRNRLKYALNGREVKAILMQRLVAVDGKVRTEPTYPSGFQDVISIEKTGEHFRLLYDVKGRFAIHRISSEEAAYKLCKIKKVQLGAKGIPYAVTHDGRTIRYPDPKIKVNDTIKFDISSGKIVDFLTFEVGQMCTITGGRNQGRVGIITHREKHEGSFDIVHVKDALDRTFATRMSNVFVIGEAGKSWISLPKGKGKGLQVWIKPLTNLLQVLSLLSLKNETEEELKYLLEALYLQDNRPVTSYQKILLQMFSGVSLAGHRVGRR